MSEPFVAEIRIFAGNFAPSGWAMCNGQLLPISQNTALFSLLGTTYGGNGTSTFGLPNLQGRVPVDQGAGAGLTFRNLGDTGGAETVTLQTPELPAHSDAPLATEATATAGAPSPGVGLAKASANIYGPARDLQHLGVGAGGGQPHNNLQPYLALNFIIALQGVFPPRA